MSVEKSSIQQYQDAEKERNTYQIQRAEQVKKHQIEKQIEEQQFNSSMKEMKHNEILKNLEIKKQYQKAKFDEEKQKLQSQFKQIQGEIQEAKP